MTLQTAPIFKVEDANVVIEMLALDLRMLREFPNHQQADDWRTHIDQARCAVPECVAMAELIVAKESAIREQLREHPEKCPHCHGSGRWKRPGAHQEWYCFCPWGEAMERGRSLDQDAFDRGITRQDPVEDVGQLAMFAGGGA